MSQKPNFIMLTSKLHALFKNYIIKGRIRCPPENDLTDMVISFQEGALTDRRALQSKFRNWSKRMAVENGDLVLASSRKIIVPQEMCDELIMSLHFEDHVEIDYLIFKIQQKYTWTKRNFGMDLDIVIGVVLKHCHKEKCISEIENYLSFDKPVLRTLQQTFPQDSSIAETSNWSISDSYGCKLGIHSTNEVFRKKYSAFFSDIHSNSTHDLKCFQTSHKSHLLENVKKSILHPIQPSQKGITKNANNKLLQLSELVMESKVKYEGNETKQVPTLCKENCTPQVELKDSEEVHLLFPKCSSEPDRKRPYESESSSYLNDRPLKRLCDEIKNVHNFKEIVNLAAINPKDFPEVFSSPKTKFLSILGLAPKRIFSKKTLSNFEFEFRKKLVMDKHQALRKHKVLRDRNKMFKRTQYSMCPPSSAIQNTKCRSLKTNYEGIRHREDYRNDKGKYITYPKGISNQAYHPFLNVYGNNLLNKSHYSRGSNRTFNNLSKYFRRITFKEHLRKLNKMKVANASMYKTKSNVVSNSKLQQHSQFPDGSYLSELSKDNNMNCVSSPAQAKSPEVIDIDSSSEEEPECKGSDSGSAFKIASRLQYGSSINPQQLSSMKNEFRVLGHSPQSTYQLNGNESQKSNNLHSINNHQREKHSYGRPYFVPSTPGNMHMFPPMRFSYPFDPIAPHPFLMNNGFPQMQPRGLNFHASNAHMWRPHGIHPMIADFNIFNKKPNGNKIASNLSGLHPVIQYPYSVPNFNNNRPTRTTPSAFSNVSYLDASIRNAPSDNGKFSTRNSSDGDSNILHSDICMPSQSKSVQNTTPSFSYASCSFSRPNIIMRTPFKKNNMSTVNSEEPSTTSCTEVGKDLSNTNVNESLPKPHSFNVIYSQPNSMTIAPNPCDVKSVMNSSDADSTNTYPGVGIDGKKKPPLIQPRIHILYSESNNTTQTAHETDITANTMDSTDNTSPSMPPDISTNASHENVSKTLFNPARVNQSFLRTNTTEIPHNKLPAANSWASSLVSHLDIDTKPAKEHNDPSLSNSSIAGPTIWRPDAPVHKPNRISNSVGINSFTSRKRHVEWIGRPTYVSSEFGSMVPSTDVCKAPKQNDNFTEVSKQMPKTFKVLLVNPPNLKKKLPIPVERRIFPKSSNILGKQPISHTNKNCLMSENDNGHFSEKSDGHLEKQNLNVDSLTNIFNESQAKDSSKKDMDGEIKNLSSWMNKMSSSLKPSTFRPRLQESLKSLTDDLAVGISLVQRIRNSLNDTEMG